MGPSKCTAKIWRILSGLFGETSPDIVVNRSPGKWRIDLQALWTKDKRRIHFLASSEQTCKRAKRQGGAPNALPPDSRLPHAYKVGDSAPNAPLPRWRATPLFHLLLPCSSQSVPADFVVKSEKRNANEVVAVAAQAVVDVVKPKRFRCRVAVTSRRERGRGRVRSVD